jgi:outer membrane protein assembly factor BamB
MSDTSLYSRLFRQWWAAMAAGLIVGFPTGVAAAGEWLGFRGGDGSGVATDTVVRRTWSEAEGIAWKVDLPGRSVSSPIVVGDLVIATTSSGPKQDQLHIVAVDRESGVIRWDRVFQATGRTLCHPTSAVAACTPASDGDRIVAFYSSCDLFCLDLEGRLLWQRNLAVEHPRAGNDVGMGSSPRIIDDAVFVQVDCQGDAFGSAIDLATGEDRWSVTRAKLASWSSPLEVNVAEHGACVLMQNPRGLELRRADDGTAVWLWEGNVGGIAMAATAEGRVFVPSSGIAAVDPTADTGRPLWQQPKLSCGISSPVVFGDSVATLNNGGVLAVADRADGSLRKQVRLAGTFWASPIVVGDTIVAVNMEGTTFVVDAGGSYEILAENDLPGSFPSTPAAADGSLYLQSETALWKTAPVTPATQP